MLIHVPKAMSEEFDECRQDLLAVAGAFSESDDLDVKILAEQIRILAEAGKQKLTFRLATGALSDLQPTITALEMERRKQLN